MGREKFPKQAERERTGGEHGTRNVQTEQDVKGSTPEQPKYPRKTAPDKKRLH